ncbi:MAG: dihydroneopterin triphosphate diphosphatase [Proteobacteria bacterium]|nr:MAG: dihydroneopterin triphosphate diphosphatase [Pseudomonadota bacterium]
MNPTGFKRPHSVLVLIHTPDAHVLLLHRRAPFDFWQSVTGSLEAGETPREAAAREVAEETGLRLASDALIDRRLANRFPIPDHWRHRYPPGVRHNTETVFSLCLPAPCDITLTPTEHDAAEWLPAAHALKRIWSWTNRDAVRLCLPHAG